MRRLREAVSGRRAARRRLESPERPVDPAVSVIVPVYNVEDYLRDCLDSILRQDFADFEVVVVDDGSPDGSAAIAAEYAERDPRIRLIGRRNGGLGAARNTGIREASGRYLTFVDSDDEIPPGALRRMVESAEASGSDIVVGSARRFNSVEKWKPHWVDTLHATARTGITIDEFPELVRNNYTWCKLYRREFWDAAGLWFREGVAYEDQPLVTQLYVRARGLDVIKESVYRYRSRDDRSSISQQTATLSDLRDRIAAWRISHEEFSRNASPEVYRAWLTTLFDAHFHWYLRSPSVSDDTYWHELQTAICELTAHAQPDTWLAVSPEKRVVIELARLDRRDDVLAFYERDGARANAHPADPYSGGLRCRLPFADDPELGDWLFELALNDVVLEHEIHAFRWIEGLTARIGGWSYLRRVDLAEHPTHTELVLRHQPTGEEQVFETTVDERPAYPPPVEHDRIDYGAGAFDCTFDLTSAARTCLREGGHWDAFLRTTTGDLTVEIPVRRIIRSSSAGIVPAGVDAEGNRVIVDWRLGEPLSFVVHPHRVEASGVTLADGMLAGTLRGPDAAAIVAIELEDAAGVAVEVGKLGQPPSGDRWFEIPVPRIDPDSMAANEHETWWVRAVGADDARIPVLYRGERQLVFGTSCEGVYAAERTRNGLLAARAWRIVALADSVRVDGDDVLHVTGRLYGARADQSSMRLRLRSRKTVVTSEQIPHSDGEFSISMPLEYDAWRFGRQGLPAAAHDAACLLADDSGREERIPLLLSQELGNQLPIPVDTDRLEGRVIRGPHNRLRLHVGRPVGEARGRYRQQRLRNASPKGDLRKALLIRSYFGESATCNGVGVLRELQRRGADLDVYWAVRDHSVPVPEGAHPVVVNSREWYDLLGSAAYYLDNMFQPEYHRKPDGQVLIQTFHGYPFKKMGVPHWEQSGRSAAEIESYARRAADWDHLVSPAGYASPLLRRDFAYDGDVLEIGYPRNDVLFADDADSLRAVVRESLGIAAHQRAVLYAPTFRDYESPDDHRAALVDLLDLDAVVSGLGDDGVLLVRGHAFNARAGENVAQRRGVIDVTGYPEVSDLYLAADAAIVDYSSLRFDFAVTGKPMVFHVPDLERYRETRGWIVDYESTAPGPLVETTDEVIDHLRDLDGLRSAHRAAYERFRREYLELEDGCAGARLVDAVMVPRGDAPSA